MKRVLFCFALAFAIDLGMTEKIAAQDTASAVQAQAAAAAQPQASAPAAVAPAPASAVVQVPEPAAPPSWAADLLTTISSLPVVGPYVSKAILYLGILAALLTSLVGFLLSALAALKTGFAWAGLDKAVAAIQAFRNGPIMYWLLYFSNFNVPPKKQVA